MIRKTNKGTTFLTTGLLVLQPTPFCNINCTYCYLPNRKDTRRMPPSVVKATVENLKASQLLEWTLTVVWHAGEPLTLPVDYYREVFAIVRDGLDGLVEVRQAVQTNLTLMTDEWCELFKEFAIHVGISLDGPASLHDRSRVSRTGAGTHEKVMRGLELVKKHKLPFNVICVLTPEHLDRADELFEYYREVAPGEVAFNVEEAEGVHRTTSLALQGVEERVECFYRKFFARAAAEGFPYGVREFRWMEEFMMESQHDCHPKTNNQIVPFGILSVAVDGSFCTFSPELLGQQYEGAPLVFGNVSSDNFLDVLDNSPLLAKIQSEITAGANQCLATCDHYFLCQGGAPSNKLYENGSFATTETLFCRLTKKRLADAYADVRESMLING